MQISDASIVLAMHRTVTMNIERGVIGIKASEVPYGLMATKPKWLHIALVQELVLVCGMHKSRKDTGVVTLGKMPVDK
jgi:hypothetical protein